MQPRSVAPNRRRVRVAALVVAVMTVGIGLLGLAAPDLLTAARRAYVGSAVGFYVAGVIRLTMGIILIRVAPLSRAPRTFVALGVVMGVQALTANVLGPERARAVLEWEVRQGAAALRLGAAVALAAGSFMVLGLARRPSAVTKS